MKAQVRKRAVPIPHNVHDGTAESRVPSTPPEAAMETSEWVAGRDPRRVYRMVEASVTNIKYADTKAGRGLCSSNGCEDAAAFFRWTGRQWRAYCLDHLR